MGFTLFASQALGHVHFIIVDLCGFLAFLSIRVVIELFLQFIN